MPHAFHDYDSNEPDNSLPFAKHYSDPRTEPTENSHFRNALREEEEEVSYGHNRWNFSQRRRHIDESGSTAGGHEYTEDPTQYELWEREESTGRSILREVRLLPYFDSASSDSIDCSQDVPLLDMETGTEGLHPFSYQEPVDVILLQSTLRSSQFQRNIRSWIPISGHWAVEVRGEVFELNRTLPWTESRLIGLMRANSRVDVFFNNWLKFTLLSMAGAESRIDVSKYEDYLVQRGEHTITRSRLGTVYMSQSKIKEQGMRIFSIIRWQRSPSPVG